MGVFRCVWVDESGGVLRCVGMGVCVDVRVYMSVEVYRYMKCVCVVTY